MTSPDADLPPQKDPNTEGVFRTLWDTVRSEQMLSIILAGIGLICLMAGNLSKSGVTADGLRATVEAMLLPLGIVTIVILVLGSMRNTVLGKTFTVLILIYLLAGMKQFLFAPYPPPMPPFYCFISIATEGCPGSPKYNRTALNEAPTEVIADPQASFDTSNPPRESPPVIIDAPVSSTPEPADASEPVDATDAIDAPASSSEEPADATEPASVELPTAPTVTSPGPVFIQFAGSLQRERIVTLARALFAQGWKMQGADRGGERTAAAAGTNEVRFFYPEDRQYAEGLALAIIGIADWVPAMEVVDLSNSGYEPARGQLEIWTSR